MNKNQEPQVDLDKELLSCTKANLQFPDNEKIWTKLGVLHLAKQDVAEGRKWILRAAEAGNLWSIAYVLYAYKEGVGVPVNEQEAGKWLARFSLAMGTSPPSCANYASEKTAPTYKASNPHSHELIRELCAEELSRNPQSVELWSYLARIHLEMEQYDKARFWAQRAAGANNALGQYVLGELYYREKIEITSDPDVDMRMANNAAGYILGNELRMDEEALAEVYRRRESAKKALSLYELAAEQGIADAQYKLGLIHMDGKTGEKNLEKANDLFEQAAESGIPEAQFRIGFNYLFGRGVPINEAEALKWFEKASGESARAQTFAGWMHWKGKGTRQNKTEAAARFSAAAKKGNLEAQYYMGMIYHTGEVPHIGKDLNKALEYLKSSEEGGYRSASELISKIEDEMRIEAQNKAQKDAGQHEQIYGPTSRDIETWVQDYATSRGMTAHDFVLDKCVGLAESDEYYCHFKASYKGQSDLSNFLAFGANMQGYMWASFRKRTDGWQHVTSFKDCTLYEYANKIRCSRLR